MEENNRKGPGVFYAVVGVATLVVAIIGATFAFFSASANDSNTIQGSTATAGGIELTVTPIATTNSSMVPLNLIKDTAEGETWASQFTDAMNADKGGVCKDSNGNNVCQIYKIVVTNNSTTATIQIRGTLKLTSTATNMYWKLISGTETGAGSTEAAYATDNNVAQVNGQNAAGEDLAKGEGHITVVGNNGGSDTTGKNASSKTLGPDDALDTTPSNTETYYVVVWLEEKGVAQETGGGAGFTDDNANYTGIVTFNAVDAAGNASGITASFSA